MPAAPKLRFDNTKVAFAHLSGRQLKKAHRLFSLINSNALVDIGTGLAEVALALHLPVMGLARSMVFDHFCGGETLDECKPVIREYGEYGVSILLNYGIEAQDTEDEYERALAINLEAIDFAAENETAKAVCLKLTGFASLPLYERIQKNESVSPEDEKLYENAKKRFHQLCIRAAERDVALYVDAEESWIQDVLDDMVNEAMQEFNREKAIVYNTYQLYRHDKLAYLKEVIEMAEKEGFILGAKLVRGAYVEKENDRARKHGYPSPLHKNKQNVNLDYNEGVLHCLDHLDHVAFCVASHNEASCMLLAERISEKGIDPAHPHIWVSQLFGMGDHITFNLAKLGINATKYLPYGPIREVIPYLIRRAKENSSVNGQMGRELRLIKKELLRRQVAPRDSMKK